MSDGLGTELERAKDQPSDAWGVEGPNQAIDEADRKIYIKNQLWRKRTFSGVSPNKGQVDIGQ